MIVRAAWLVFLFMAGAAAAQGQAIDCSPPAGSERIWDQASLKYLIVGDVHGTNEAPAAFSELVCAAAAQGRHVLVGLEQPEVDAQKFTTYLASAGTAGDKRDFLIGNSWSVSARAMPDGRTSVAMWSLIERLRQLRGAGLRIDVSAFVRPYTGVRESQTPYERNLAASLLEAETALGPELVLVLVGSAHAMRMPFEASNGLSFEPMAMHLPQENLLSLFAVHEGGEAWNCFSRDDCAAHVTRANVPAALTDSVDSDSHGVILGKELRPGFDGVLRLGTISAAAPYKGD